ncbi:hypothetical protein ACFQ6U_07830 [Streptomyces sp. NPDC056465]|uniref:hypothetical protein n=1 Tax=unclassified Streptomyces TaxID=2593676 RepID=UPI0036A497BA
MPVRSLRIAAHTELVTLAAMLANLATVHLGPVSSLMGPTHGCAYLFVVVAAWRSDGATAAARAVAVVPGIGGLLAWRRLVASAPPPEADRHDGDSGESRQHDDAPGRHQAGLLVAEDGPIAHGSLSRTSSTGRRPSRAHPGTPPADHGPA